MNKDLNDVSQHLVFSLLGGGIHAEEEFIPCIRVKVYNHRANDGKFVLVFIVKIYSRLILYLEIGY